MVKPCCCHYRAFLCHCQEKIEFKNPCKHIKDIGLINNYMKNVFAKYAMKKNHLSYNICKGENTLFLK